VRWALAFVCVLSIAGCRQLLGFDTPALGGDARASGDGATDALATSDVSAPCTSWQARHFDPCALPAPSAELVLQGAWVFSTDTGELTSGASIMHPAGTTLAQNGNSADKIYVMSIASLVIENAATVQVIGSVPLVVASWSSIEIDGTIDAGGMQNQPGPGSNPMECESAAARQGQTAAASAGSGGGGGGAFQGSGGHAGTGDNPPVATGGAGGTSIAAPAFVRGGCSGAPSGQAGPGAMDPTAISSGGAGGGALELAARTSIEVRGEVLAGGGGGGGAPLQSSCGGGGGGAGGYLGFDSPMLRFDSGALIAANGGGGGGGAPFAAVGEPGQDGQASAMQAEGGAVSSCSEAGMLGGAGTTPNGASSSNPIEACGGAGGGGGVGYVLTWASMMMTIGAVTVSPPALAGP
jgi:hypothetical protein